MRIQFLGSGDAFGSGGRFQTCILVESGGVQFLLDCGASSLIALKRAGVNLNDIQTVLITHLHGDHFGGIPFLILDGQFSGRSRPLQVFGPPGIAERIHQTMEALFPGSSNVRRRFATKFVELVPDSTTAFDHVSVTPQEVLHPCGAPPFALRVEVDGRTIGYSGDTAWTDGLRAVAAEADLFIAEAYTYDKPVRFHLDYATIMRHRADLDCQRLLLTHMGSDMLAHLGEVADEVAYDGLELTL